MPDLASVARRQDDLDLRMFLHLRLSTEDVILAQSDRQVFRWGDYGDLSSASALQNLGVPRDAHDSKCHRIASTYLDEQDGKNMVSAESMVGLMS